MQRNKFSLWLTAFLIVVLAFGLLPAGAVRAATDPTNDDNVWWDGTGHIPGVQACGVATLPYRSPMNALFTDAVTIRARSYKGDLTGITVWYTTNQAATSQADWSSVNTTWEANCDADPFDYDVWTAAIPAADVPVWYVLEYKDGTDSDWRVGRGEGTIGFQDDLTDWTVGTKTLFYTPTGSLVRPGDLKNWFFFVEGGAPLSGFVIGPDTPPLGDGSLYMETPATADKISFGTLSYASVYLKDFTMLSYSTYVDTTSPDFTAIALQLNIDYDLDDTNTAWQGRLVYEPYFNGTVTKGTWQNWDALAGEWWASGAPGNTVCPSSNPCSLAEVLTHFPRAGLHGDPRGGLLFSAGSGWLNFSGYVDNLDVAINNGNDVTYDFEPIDEVWVDDDFTAATPGWGIDHFAVIQDGIDAVIEGGTVHVAAGTYVETNLLIDKSLALLGPNQGINPNTETRVPEAVVIPGTSDPDPFSAGAVNILYIDANNVAIDGLTFDGDNPTIDSGILVNGVDVDAAEALSAYDGAGSLRVENNIIKNISYAGMDFYNAYNGGAATSNNYVRYNWMDNIGHIPYGYGIGILIYNNFYAAVDDNVITRVRVGVQTGNYHNANPGTTASISRNHIEASRRGIFHNLAYSNAAAFTLAENEIGVVDEPGASRFDGIMLSSLQTNVDAIVVDNIITGTDVSQLTVGHQVWNTPTNADLTISGGTVTGLDYGVWVNNYDGYNEDANNTHIKLSDIQIVDSTLAGIYVKDNPSEVHGHTATATLVDGVIIQGSPIGVWVEGYSASATTSESLIFGNTSGVTLEDGAVATLFNNDLSGNTLTVDNQTGVDINASGNWFGTTDPTMVAALVSANVDYTPWLDSGTDSDLVTDGFQGDFSALHVDDDSPQTGATGRIQEGVNLVSGSTVYVHAGTYTEQVVITKDLDLLGEDQATTVIQAFASMPTCFTTSAANHPVVCVMDATATIDNFTIDGLGLGNSNYKFEGVAFRNADGTLSNSTIKDIRDTPFSGAQHGVAVYAYNTAAEVFALNVHNNTITGFQKNAMALNAGDTTPMTIDVRGNIITGAGITTVTAQNGIQAWGDLITGLVEDNVIDGIAYDGGNYVATSILNYYADLDINGNTITTAHMAIYNVDGAGTINDNEITVVEASGYAYGIVATDPPQAVPSPYEPQAKPAATKGAEKGILSVEVAYNTVVFSGPDNTNSIAIEADGGYGPDSLTVDVHDNLVNGFDYGLFFYQCDPDNTTTPCSSGIFTSISADYNDLVGNNVGIYLGGPISAGIVSPMHHNRIFGGGGAVGLYNDLTFSLTAENNWWGCNEGPTGAGGCDVIIGTGLVDANPWLVLEADFDPLVVLIGEEAVLNAQLTKNLDGTVFTTDFIPDTTPASFTADRGVFDPADTTLIDGLTQSTYTAPALPGADNACITVDAEEICFGLVIISSPVAVDDFYETDEDVALVVAAPGVLENDFDLDGDSMKATLKEGPLHGTLELFGDGSFVYIPEKEWSGVDQFTYTLVTYPAKAWVDEAVVTITVNWVNDWPVAEDDEYSVVAGGGLTVPADGVLANDSDLDVEHVPYASLVTDAQHGWLTLRQDGSFTYIPDEGFVGDDTFEYMMVSTFEKGGPYTDNAWVTIHVLAPTAAPIADQAAYSMTPFGLTLDASAFADATSENLAYSAALADGNPLPAWLSFDPVTLSFNGMPENGDAGTLVVKVFATDETGSYVSNKFQLITFARFFLPMIGR